MGGFRLSPTELTQCWDIKQMSGEYHIQCCVSRTLKSMSLFKDMRARQSLSQNTQRTISRGSVLYPTITTGPTPGRNDLNLHRHLIYLFF